MLTQRRVTMLPPPIRARPWAGRQLSSRRKAASALTLCWTQGLTPEQAAERFYILDADGLVTQKRGDALTDTVRPFARKEGEMEGARLEDVVKHVRAPPGSCLS